MSRQAGWYWVKEEGCPSWVVAEHPQEEEAEWVDNSGRELYWVAEVGPRIPTPDEPWQCVPVEPTREMLASYEKASVAPIGPLSVRGYIHMVAAAPKPGGSDE